MNRLELHKYQARAMQFIKDNPFCALWVDMGLGKTVSTLTAIVDLINGFEVGRVLIVAPLRVAEHTWPEEIRQWEHTKGLDYGLLTGARKDRVRELHRVREVHIINREKVEWLVDAVGTKWPYDMVVIDESSSFKSHRAKRFKAMRKVAPYIDRMVQLTGTPASNGLMDVWSQIYLLDKGDRLGKTITKYRSTYFNQGYMGYTWDIREGADTIIHAKLKDICLTMSAEDYITLPSRVDNVISVDVSDSARAKYRGFEKEFLLELENDTVEASTAATLTGKLLQFCNGAVYTDRECNWEKIHDAKIEALDSIVEESVGQPILVAYSFKSDLERLKKRYPKAITLDDSAKAIDRWNAGEIQMLLIHPASAGHGLNLQKGGNIAVWFGLNWSLELYQQFNARLHRQGQIKPVIIHHIVVKDSVDETVLQALKDKHTTQKALLDALKKDIANRVTDGGK